MQGIKNLICTFLIFFASLHQSLTQTNRSENVSTTCGENEIVDILLPVNRRTGLVSVNLTPSQAQSSGLSCIWKVRAPPQNESTELVLLGTDNGTECYNNIYSIYEENPETGNRSPLPFGCRANFNNTVYTGVTGQVASALVVQLRATSPLPQNFRLMFLLSALWTDDTCPRYGRKVIHTGKPDELSGRADEVSSLRWGHISKALPRNLTCRWEFRALDEGLVFLKLVRTIHIDGTCESNATFRISNAENSASPTMVPFCPQDGDYIYTYVSSTGSAFVDFETLNGFIRSMYFDLEHQSQPSCPSIEPLQLDAEPPRERLLKGSSYSAQGAGHSQTCRWHLHTYRSLVIRLNRLEAPDFKASCNASTDFLLLDGRKIELCGDRDPFPLWTESWKSDLELQSVTTNSRRNLLLRYKSAKKTACQGHAKRVKVIFRELQYGSERLPAFSANDSDYGAVCQWIFTASATGYGVHVTVDKAVPGKEADGVSYDPKNCSYSRFKVYSGYEAFADREITPSCTDSLGTPVLKYTTDAKDMLFVYTRPSSADEDGLVIRMKQVKPGTGGGTGGAVPLGNKPGVLLFLLAFASLAIPS